MTGRFDDWEGQHLEHHGIPGIKWGVRRYQEKDGSLTAVGRARYGFGAGEGSKRTSARKMQRDFNNLDKGYANAVADQKYNARRTAQLSRKMHKAEQKGNEKKAAKLKAKAMKSANAAALNNKQKKAIEALQWKIIGKAATEGYTTTSKAVKRYGTTEHDRKMARALLATVGGGAIPGIGAALITNRHAQTVDGQQVKIRKHGPGGTKIINYNEGRNYAQEERLREAAKKRKNYNR